MKALLAGLILFAGLSAQATSLQMTLDETLHKVSINGKPVGLVEFVHVDFQQNTITVSLYQDPCGHYSPLPPGTLRCMMMPILKSQYEVPLQSATTDGCGVSTYSGKKDLRMVDGALTAIKLVDFSRATCADSSTKFESTVIQGGGFRVPAPNTVVKASYTLM